MTIIRYRKPIIPTESTTACYTQAAYFRKLQIRFRKKLEEIPKPDVFQPVTLVCSKCKESYSPLDRPKCHHVPNAYRMHLWNYHGGKLRSLCFHCWSVANTEGKVKEGSLWVRTNINPHFLDEYNVFEDVQKAFEEEKGWNEPCC